MRQHTGVMLLSVAFLAVGAGAAEPLHKRIDRLVAARARGQPVSPPAGDTEFLRRATLDFAGRIPSVKEARAFLNDRAADKRVRLIDRLLAGPAYSRRMQQVFHVLLMERLGDNADWASYLRTSFEKNKPWDRMARELLHASADDATARGAAFFMTRRLEHYGENPVDYPGLTRDIGRLFLGIDLRCAQCHDHLTVVDYRQRDFQGLFAFVQNAAVGKASPPTVAERPPGKKVAFLSVFEKVPLETGPRVPGRKELPVAVAKKGEPLKLSLLARLAEEVAAPDNRAFNRNIANRLWFLLMGRGLVQPLDLHHSANPPSHPELLDLLARAFVAHKYDVKWFVRELALSQTYQRSGVLPDGRAEVDPKSFLTALEKRLSAEQLLESMLEATGEKERLAGSKGKALAAARTAFRKAFANGPRDPEETFTPSVKSALFVLNDATVLGWLRPQPGNLIDRLARLSDAGKVAEELYLSVLTRMPTAEEKAEVAQYLAKHAARRAVALGHLAWALLASTEFCVNH